MELMVEASPRRIFANAHTYHINSISVNSDQETYLSADDLRINLWHLEITDQSFSILFYAMYILNNLMNLVFKYSISNHVLKYLHSIKLVTVFFFLPLKRYQLRAMYSVFFLSILHRYCRH